MKIIVIDIETTGLDILKDETASVDNCFKTLEEAKQCALDILNDAAEHVKSIKEEDL